MPHSTITASGAPVATALIGMAVVFAALAAVRLYIALFRRLAESCPECGAAEAKPAAAPRAATAPVPAAPAAPAARPGASGAEVAAAIAVGLHLASTGAQVAAAAATALHLEAGKRSASAEARGAALGWSVAGRLEAQNSRLQAQYRPGKCSGRGHQRTQAGVKAA